MSGDTETPAVGSLPDTAVRSPFVPVALTWFAWSLFAASLAVLGLGTDPPRVGAGRQRLLHRRALRTHRGCRPGRPHVSPLHDWSTDPDGEALEAIVTGPMVITQWINSQYYVSTVDTAVYGSGSKVTQNPVGNVGVYQGNGGDLMSGLPQQSLMAADEEPYHQPVRLSTVIHAPVERVTAVLAENGAVTELLDNNWLSLTVVDPTQEHRAFQYAADLEWTPVSETPATAAATSPTAADD